MHFVLFQKYLSKNHFEPLGARRWTLGAAGWVRVLSALRPPEPAWMAPVPGARPGHLVKKILGDG